MCEVVLALAVCVVVGWVSYNVSARAKRNGVGYVRLDESKDSDTVDSANLFSSMINSLL